jgi:hypothetical protein
MTLGNVFESDPKAIWKGEAYQNLRRLHSERKFDEIPLCMNCNVWEHRHPENWNEAMGVE